VSTLLHAFINDFPKFAECIGIDFLFIYYFFTIYSRYLKRVISKRDGCEYLKQVPSIDSSLEIM
jgi:hypothetical protein